MLTLYAIPKPFAGHIGIIQRNAIESWLRLEPRPEIILFGDEEGIADAARQFNVAHVAQVARNEYGTPLLNDVFSKAAARAQHDRLCFLNCDIMLLADFVKVVRRAPRPPYLLVSRRWNLDVPEPIRFDGPAWEAVFRDRVAREATLFSEFGIDIFIFPRGFWGELPPFAIGRPIYDNWLLWRARSLHAPVIDCTKAMTIVHQNHVYNQHPDGKQWVRHGPEIERNLELAGGRPHVFSLRHANRAMSRGGRIHLVVNVDSITRRARALPVLPPPAGANEKLQRACLLVADWL
jgi:hypothetical protein